MSSMKPLLVGESNPYSLDIGFALYPHPPRCAGWNLCHRIMGVTENEYLERFDRVNLCAGKWSVTEARLRATALIWERNPDGTIVLFGKKVTDCFCISFEKFTIRRTEGPVLVILPHPSGLSRAWNEPGAFERARSVLKEAGVL